MVAGAITAYWAVQMTGGNWYSSAKPIPISIVSANNYLLDQLAFHTAATNWNNLTVSGTTVTIGSQASSALAGSITGAGIIMIHNDTTGASMNWENFAITTNAVTQVAPTINDRHRPVPSECRHWRRSQLRRDHQFRLPADYL